MFRKFKRLSAVLLASVIAVNVSYAGVSMPPDQFKDPVKQFQYVSKIARSDNPTWANFKLGMYYENGLGTNKNILKAYAYYRIASGRSPDFLKSLDSLKSHMSAQQISEGDKEYNKIVSANLAELNKSVNETGF